MSLFLSSASRLRHLVDCSSDLKSAFDHELDLALKWVYVEVSSLLIKGFDKSFGNCGRVFMEYSSKDELKVIINNIVTFKFICDIITLCNNVIHVAVELIN